MNDQEVKSANTLFNSIPNINPEDFKEIELRLKEARDKAQELIRTYPLTSVAIGLGIGFLIGRMFSKK